MFFVLPSALKFLGQFTLGSKQAEKEEKESSPHEIQSAEENIHGPINRDREALAGFPSHTTRHTGPYQGGSV
jgi:hypothetical protein